MWPGDMWKWWLTGYSDLQTEPMKGQFSSLQWSFAKNCFVSCNNSGGVGGTFVSQKDGGRKERETGVRFPSM